ncbi:MAG: 5-formyltetrahydrofolate cyclo-ligase [Candidatus Binatia bacterium]
MGRGGGHYDRVFAGPIRPAGLIGLGYTFQQCAGLPRDAWDLRLDAVVTERGVVRCWRGGDSSPHRKEDTGRDGHTLDSTDRPRLGRRPRRAGRLPQTPAS